MRVRVRRLVVADAGRSTEIVFVCSTIDRLLSVEEFETCAYVAELATPAACSTESEGALPPYMGAEATAGGGTVAMDDRFR